MNERPAPEPRLGPTRPATLVVAALASAAVAWLLISRFYGEFPQLPWLPTATLTALAVLEGYAAMNTRARIERRPGQEPVNPLLVARLVVLAKASSLAGAIFGGFYAGLVVWLAIERTRAATNDLPAGVAGLVAGVVLMVAALWLERSCRVPEQPEEDREPGAGQS
jgi:hypothetical protein